MKLSEYIVCTAKILVKEDKIDEVLKIFAELKNNSPKEPGCLRYELHRDVDNHNLFLFVDRFKDMDAFNFHCQQEYTIKYFDHILPGLTESIEFNIYREINY